MSTQFYNLTLDEIVSLLGHYTTVTLKDKKLQAGFIYTIDPESGNVVLFESIQQRVIVVMSHFIQDVKIDIENRIELKNIDTILKYQEKNKFTQEWLDNRKRKLIQLFQKNRIPIESNQEEPVICVLGSAHVKSPYTATSVVCENALVRKRVRDLILQLELD